MPRLSLIAALLLSVCTSLVRADLFDGPVASIDGDPELEKVVVRLAAESRVRSRFRQIKKVKLLKKPLISEGSMVFDRDHGLWWHVRSPFESTLVVTGDRLMQRTGSTGSTLSIAQNPLAFAFARTFFQVLSGDIRTLARDFELFFQRGNNHWELGLVPRDKQMRAVIADIVLSGDIDLQSIRIRDHVGDTTEMEFIQRQPGGPALTDQERAQFVF